MEYTMAVIDLGTITIDDTILDVVKEAFGQPTAAPVKQLESVLRLLARRHLRQEAVQRRLDQIEEAKGQEAAQEKAAEQAQLESGWPRP